jgi:predicted NBD/HSP70 family sugar kinase
MRWWSTGTASRSVRRAAPPRVEAGYREVLKRLRDTALEALADARIGIRDINAIGLGMPGPVDQARGRVVVAPNLGWRTSRWQRTCAPC